MEHTLTIRLATVDDVPTLVHHRRAMFEDMGHKDRAILDGMDRSFAPWVTDKINRGEYMGWLAVSEKSEIVAGAGLWFVEWPPTVVDLSTRRAYLLNVYTESEYRRLGLARQLVTLMMDYCRDLGIRVITLHASDQGRSLYETLGFAQTNEMRILF